MVLKVTSVDPYNVIAATRAKHYHFQVKKVTFRSPGRILFQKVLV